MSTEVFSTGRFLKAATQSGQPRTAATGNAVFKFADETTAADRAEAPITRGRRADVRLKALHCACGRALQPYDVEADEQLVRLVCPRSHTELLVVELSAGAPS